MMKLWLSTNKGVLELSKVGASWELRRTHFLAVKSPMMLPGTGANSRRVWAALSHGHFGSKMHRSEDGGTTWAEIGVPSYPAYPDGVEPEKNPVSGKPIKWDLEFVWALEEGGRPGELWCGTLPGGVFKSRDHGDTWELCESLWRDPRRLQWMGGGYDSPGVHSICVDPRNPDHVVIGVSTGGLWETFDGGTSWSLEGEGMIAGYMPPGQQLDRLVQDAHRVAVSGANFNSMWVQHHCGMFKSADGGKTFKQIGPEMGKDAAVKRSGFGFAVAAHPGCPKTAWFVPAIADEMRVPVGGRLEVAKTVDGGETFAWHGKGLPSENAFDLVYRHALDVAPDGTTLAMGSTTGNLWISRDGGESWDQVSGNLPPIYCARFGP